MTTIKMEFPDEMIAFAKPSNKEDELKRNAMILYPYIKQGTISHGKAAEILGIFKMDLITLYGNLELPYIELTDDEIDEELAMIDYLKGTLA